jgi:hypothetical protein
VDARQQTEFCAQLQLLYGLDGRPRRQPDGVQPPPEDWLAWSEQAVERAPKPSTLPLDPAEASAARAALHPTVVMSAWALSGEHDTVGTMCSARIPAAFVYTLSISSKGALSAFIPVNDAR